METPNNKIT